MNKRATRAGLDRNKQEPMRIAPHLPTNSYNLPRKARPAH